MNSQAHIPVLLQEVLEGLALSEGDIIIDGTVGGGGHTRAILERTAPSGIVIGFDRDKETLDATTAVLQQEFADRFIPIHDSYAAFAQHEELDGKEISGMLVDLGFSSIQIDDAGRGFSFQSNGPLDMRFDRTQGDTAADVLNSQPEEELRRIFSEYGEIRQSKRLARAVVAHRDEQPFVDTTELLMLVEAVLGGRRGRRIHPATQVFQALRIAVNDELTQVERFLPQAIERLAPGGRLAVISFHSLEDRIVKHTFKRLAARSLPNPDVPSDPFEQEPTIRLVNKKPIVPTEEEVAGNPRARSAKLRVIEKL